jgi:hypothetical protein
MSIESLIVIVVECVFVGGGRVPDAKRSAFTTSMRGESIFLHSYE